MQSDPFAMHATQLHGIGLAHDEPLRLAQHFVHDFIADGGDAAQIERKVPFVSGNKS